MHSKNYASRKAKTTKNLGRREYHVRFNLPCRLPGQNIANSVPSYPN